MFLNFKEQKLPLFYFTLCGNTLGLSPRSVCNNQISLTVVLPCPQHVTHSRRTLTNRFSLSRSIHYPRLHCNWKKNGDFTMRFHFIKLYFWKIQVKKYYLYLLLFQVFSFIISRESVLIPFKNTCLSPLLHPCYPWPASSLFALPFKQPPNWIILLHTFLDIATRWSVRMQICCHPPLC